MDFCQTFVTGASWDTDDLITFLGQKVKVQGHTIASEAHSTRRYRRVQHFLVSMWICHSSCTSWSLTPCILAPRCYCCSTTNHSSWKITHMQALAGPAVFGGMHIFMLHHDIRRFLRNLLLSAEKCGIARLLLHFYLVHVFSVSFLILPWNNKLDSRCKQWLNSAGTGRNGVLQPVSGVPPPEIAIPPPKVVVPPSGDAVASTLYFLVSWFSGKS